MTPMLFCNVAWMKDYKGERADDRPIGGGKHPEKGEHTNFKPSGGKLFGYVRASSGLKLTRLGAGESAHVHSPVDVVWMATRPEGGRVVVGWYLGATAFRELQDRAGRLYHFTASATNCHLLKPDERHLEIESGQKRKGGPGQNPVWYADGDYGQEIKRNVEELIYSVPMFDRQRLSVAAKVLGAADVPPAGFDIPLRKTQSTVVYGRCPKVNAHVLRRAKGKCELCNAPAPFEKEDNTPFLEVHHIKPLAEGGPDRPDNAVALCPNCHREAHYGSKRADVRRRLKRNLKTKSA